MCSEHPATELKQYVYDFAVESGLPIVVYSSMSKKEIQNAVIDLVKAKCIESVANENERDWLELEMTEYDNHGFFWYPEELNDFIPNGFFWNNYVFFDEFKILSFTNCFSNLHHMQSYKYKTLAFDSQKRVEWMKELIEKYEAFYMQRHKNCVVCIGTSSDYPFRMEEASIIECIMSRCSGTNAFYVYTDDKLEQDMRVTTMFYE